MACVEGVGDLSAGLGEGGEERIDERFVGDVGGFEEEGPLVGELEAVLAEEHASVLGIDVELCAAGELVYAVVEEVVGEELALEFG